MDFRNKSHLVDELAKRWWYALEEWPPANFNYDVMLKSVGFREVEHTKFKSEQEFDANHYRKVT